MSNAAKAIAVEVILALPEQAQRIVLQVPADSTLAQALNTPAVLACFPGAANLPAGIFGHRCEPSRRLRDGDRIELYRPLVVDAKAARRERAAKLKS